MISAAHTRLELLRRRKVNRPSDQRDVLSVRICPNPMAWDRVYRTLRDRWAANRHGASPPVPLILNGWVFSNDAQKKDRWEQLVEWAVERGWDADVVVPQSEFYCVEEIDSGRVGPIGGPMFLPWRFTAARKPTAAEVRAAEDLLRRDWENVAGLLLARITTPLGFTGRKKRRLLVEAHFSSPAPWGTWNTLSSDERRREFTQLRFAVNEAVAPLEVDHIDFIPIR